MGLLQSRCPTCGRAIAIVFDDRNLETLLVERTCGCPTPRMPRVVTD